MPRFPLWFCLISVPVLLSAQQPERYTVTGDPVAIYNLVGSVRVEPHEGEGVLVQVTRAGGEAARLRIAQGDLHGRATLRVVYPGDQIRWRPDRGRTSTQLRVRDDGTFGDLSHDHPHERRGRDGADEGRRVTVSSERGMDARADLLIGVPKGRRVAVYLAVGSVAVTNVNGDLAVDAHDAPVTATGVQGALTVDVGSGSVRISQVQGDLRVDTGSGSVDVSRVRSRTLMIDTGSGEVTGAELECDAVAVQTGSGGIRLTGVAAPSLSLDTGSGEVSADLRRDPVSLRAETGSGNVTIRAPATLGARVTIETSSGDIETDFPMQITRRGREGMDGTIGDGRGTIAIETASGRISLLKRSP
ncbi:MAG: DUF4097 family beta strand repeat-containing protein [Gemmatimonadales bacterium]